MSRITRRRFLSTTAATWRFSLLKLARVYENDVKEAKEDAPKKAAKDEPPKA